MNTIQKQFNEMLERGRLPYLEYEVMIDGEKEWLLLYNSEGIHHGSY